MCETKHDTNSSCLSAAFPTMITFRLFVRKREPSLQRKYCKHRNSISLSGTPCPSRMGRSTAIVVVAMGIVM